MSSELLQELLAEIKGYPDGADLLITAFYTAAYHYRRGTICTPFPPPEVLPPAAATTKEKDFPALQQALAALPPVHTLLGGDEVLRDLPPQARAVLQWLILNPTRRRRRFTMVAPRGELVRQLRQRAGGADGGTHGRAGWQLPPAFSFSGHNAPAFVLRAHEGHDQEPYRRGTIAFHGTHLENLHSILHTGLQPMSGTRLQRTGANFGAGIYLSTNYETAFSFCQPCDSWPRSRYGSKLRVLLVCEVDLERCSAERGAGAEASARAAATGGESAKPPASPSYPSATTTLPATATTTTSPSSSPSSSLYGNLPDTYLLVQRADAVRILFVLVYCDARVRTARQPRVNWCTALVVLYAAFLMGKALLAALKQYRY